VLRWYMDSVRLQDGVGDWLWENGFLTRFHPRLIAARWSEQPETDLLCEKVSVIEFKTNEEMVHVKLFWG